MLSRTNNRVMVRNLTSDACQEYDVSHRRQFLVAPGLDFKALAAADASELKVIAILAHRSKRYRIGPH